MIPVNEFPEFDLTVRDIDYRHSTGFKKGLHISCYFLFELRG